MVQEKRHRSVEVMYFMNVESKTINTKGTKNLCSTDVRSTQTLGPNILVYSD